MSQSCSALEFPDAHPHLAGDTDLGACIMNLLFFLFIFTPIIEMWLLIEVGSRIGALNTILLVLLTATIGVILLRQQGLSTLFRFQRRMEQGEMPAAEILEGLALAVGGALLLTPGFVTDTIGFLCMVPLTRKGIIAFLLKRGMANMAKGGVQGHYQQRQTYRDGEKEVHTTIEGEYHRDDK